MLIDGKHRTLVDAMDRGFQYGDGVFETVAIHQGVPLFFSRHLERLKEGCRRLVIDFPDGSQLFRETQMLCRSVVEGVLKIQLTRGVGGRGYRCPEHCNTTRVLSVHPSPDYPVDIANVGIKARLCKTRLGINPTLAGIKHMNRLEQILARLEWDDPDIREGLILDTAGHVVEGTMSNLFLVKNGCLLTPKIDRCGVAGIMRALVIEQAANNGTDVKRTRLTVDDLWEADELFVTNSVIDCWPITQLEDVRYPLGTVTRQIGLWINRLKQGELNRE